MSLTESENYELCQLRGITRNLCGDRYVRSAHSSNAFGEKRMILVVYRGFFPMGELDSRDIASDLYDRILALELRVGSNTVRLKRMK